MLLPSAFELRKDLAQLGCVDVVVMCAAHAKVWAVFAFVLTEASANLNAVAEIVALEVRLKCIQVRRIATRKAGAAEADDHFGLGLIRHDAPFEAERDQKRLALMDLDKFRKNLYHQNFFRENDPAMRFALGGIDCSPQHSRRCTLWPDRSGRVRGI